MTSDLSAEPKIARRTKHHNHPAINNNYSGYRYRLSLFFLKKTRVISKCFEKCGTSYDAPTDTRVEHYSVFANIYDG